MADFRDTIITRRGLGAVGALAAFLPIASAAPGRSPVLYQAQRVAALYRAHDAAFELFLNAEGQDGEAELEEAANVVWAEWKVAAGKLAEMPATSTLDLLAKLSAVARRLEAPSDEDSAIADSLLADLWSVVPELRPLMRWHPPGTGDIS